VTETPAVEPVSERMQELLSRAVEEQVSEQRAASSVLHDLKEQLAALEAGVRSAAANDTVARLDTAVTTVVADQRTATTLLSQRLEALTSRVEALSALGGDVNNQAAALGRVQATLENFSSFPGALSALQQDVSGLHDRLAPLADVQAAMGDLGARAAGEADSLRPQLSALEARLASLDAPDADRLRDAVVDALSIRLERLQQAVDRPVVGPEVL
jgi:DNA repair exonuclease SbcCD ATPase subunit